MPTKKIAPPLLAILFLLMACTARNTAAPRTATPTGIYSPQPTGISPTQAPTITPTEVDPFATYQNSFEAITDITASGITSNKNGLSAGFKSAVRINKDIVHSGSQSLEVFGTIGSPAGSILSIDFPVRSLIGKDTMDLSNKILHVSVFIPKGSPIDKVFFAFSHGSQFAIIPVLVAGVADVKGRWYSNDINLKRFSENQSAVAYGQDRNGAKVILWDCDTISLVGQRSTQGGTPSSRFMVDDLKWSDAPYTLDSVPVDHNVDSMRKYADLHNLKIGSLLLAVGATDYMMDPLYVQTLAKEFNLVSGINTNWPEVKPANPSDFYLDYTHNDDVFKLLSGAQLSQKGATGGWHLQLPKWLLDEDFHNLQPYLESRIEKDMNRYKGNAFLWDVFNETVADSGIGFRNRQQKGPSAGDLAPYGYSYSPWVDGSDVSLIRAAFVKARQTDPNAKLFLNDFDNDLIGQPKAETFYRLTADMKQAGVPIDGVGFQMRVWINGDTVGTWNERQQIDVFLGNLDKSVKRFSQLGLLVEFSEVEVGIRVDDIDLSTPAGKNVYELRLANQARVYGGLAKIALENKNVAAFVIWMVSDRYPQGAVAPGYGDTSLLDAEYKPKPAYYAVMDELKNNSG
jgi:endo-1,4-beta-xylanase